MSTKPLGYTDCLKAVGRARAIRRSRTTEIKPVAVEEPKNEDEPREGTIGTLEKARKVASRLAKPASFTGSSEMDKVVVENRELRRLYTELSERAEQKDASTGESEEPSVVVRSKSFKRRERKSANKLAAAAPTGQRTKCATVTGSVGAGAKTPRARGPRRKPEAVEIRTTGSLDYREAYKTIRSDPSLEELGKQIKRVRLSKQGHMLVELSSGEPGRSLKIQSELARVLDGTCVVRALLPTVDVVCRNLHLQVTPETLAEAFKQQLTIHSEANEIRLAATRHGTQVAFIRLPARLATEKVKNAVLRIGSSDCPIHIEAHQKKCYRCHELGHKAVQCRK